MPDPFTLESGDYSPDEFYIASKDKSRESVSWRVNVPAYVAGQVSAIVQQRNFPVYRTREDFVRDAIVHRMHYLGTMTQDTRMLLIVEQERKRSRTEMMRWMAEMENDIVQNLTIAASRPIHNPSVVQDIRGQLQDLLISDSPDVRRAAHHLLDSLG